MSVRDAGEPITAFALLQYLLPVDAPPIAPSTIDVGTCVAWVVQCALCRRYGERLKNRDMPVAKSSWKTKALVPKHLDHLGGGTHARECIEEVCDRLPDLRVGVERHVAGFIVHEAGGEDTAILTPSHLVEDPAPQPGLEDMQFSLAHCSFEAE
jgi:hypothetical protein